jgi:hypothetical protein
VSIDFETVVCLLILLLLLRFSDLDFETVLTDSVGTVLNSNRKITETNAKPIPTYECRFPGMVRHFTQKKGGD